MNGESFRLVTVGGECFTAAPRRVLEYVERDGLLYKYHLTDMVSNRGKRLVSLFASGTLGVVVASQKPRIQVVCFNAIRRAFDSGSLSFDTQLDETHYTELPLLESDFQTQQARTDPEIRQYIIHKAYWLAYRFPMQPQHTDVLYPIPFDEYIDLDYLGVTSPEVWRNIQRLANQGLLEKVSEGHARPSERLLSRYESGDSSGLGLPTVVSTASVVGGETDDRKFERLAIEEARKSAPEDVRVHPKVGVVVVKDGRVLATAHRGEIPQGHAEFIALEKKLADVPLLGATVYTTLEPCTSRNHPKVPCAIRLTERKVARVVIGMLDPDDRISGRGQRTLRKAGIDTVLFPGDLMAEIEELNRDFIREKEAAQQKGTGPENRNAEPVRFDFRLYSKPGQHIFMDMSQPYGRMNVSVPFVGVSVSNKSERHIEVVTCELAKVQQSNHTTIETDQIIGPSDSGDVDVTRRFIELIAERREPNWDEIFKAYQVEVSVACRGERRERPIKGEPKIYDVEISRTGHPMLAVAISPHRG